MSGLALPISNWRYICAESTLMRSTGKCFLSSIARSVLPEAVGPMIKMANGNSGEVM